VKDDIVMTHGELLVSQDVTILSVPARTPTISGNGVSRVFEIAAGANVALHNLNITGSVPDLREPFSFGKGSRARVAAAETDALSENNLVPFRAKNRLVFIAGQSALTRPPKQTNSNDEGRLADETCDYDTGGSGSVARWCGAGEGGSDRHKLHHKR
jgi:hypothetical protein